MKATFISIAIAGVLLLTSCQQGTSKKQGVSNKDGIPVGLEIGNIAPEIAEQSVNGEMLKLSSLQGNMVLIDFWASWCPPCREENPNLVKTYHEFKNARFKNGDGFTIFSVSFDKKKDAWLKGIENDKLVWEYHVSDLNGWSSAAGKLYNIQAIPSNYLIDGDGIIIDYNLRGEVLDSVLLTLKVMQ